MIQSPANSQPVQPAASSQQTEHDQQHTRNNSTLFVVQPIRWRVQFRIWIWILLAARLTVPLPPASRRRAGVEALIGVDGVAVITALTVLNHAITAADRLTSVAVVRGVIVAVIAALSRPDHAVAAARLKAAGQARVAVDLVAVITSFKADLTVDEVISNHAVTAAG